MNVDLSQLTDLINQFITAVKSGNLAAIFVVLLSGWALWKKFRTPATPATPAVTPTAKAALHLLDNEATTPAEKALVAAVAQKK